MDGEHNYHLKVTTPTQLKRKSPKNYGKTRSVKEKKETKIAGRTRSQSTDEVISFGRVTPFESKASLTDGIAYDFEMGANGEIQVIKSIQRLSSHFVFVFHFYSIIVV